jgi:hypothetical protein
VCFGEILLATSKESAVAAKALEAKTKPPAEAGGSDFKG